MSTNLPNIGVVILYITSLALKKKLSNSNFCTLKSESASKEF